VDQPRHCVKLFSKKDYRMIPVLVTVQDLRRDVAAGGVRVFDCRHDLARPSAGADAWREAHVPGAVFLHLDHDLSGAKTGKNGRHPLPDRDWMAARLRAAGLRRGERVVAYDAGPGMFAARLWWMLRWLGHRDVAVLGGGWKAWTGQGGEVSAEAPAVVAGDFVAQAPLERVVGAGEVLAGLGSGASLVIDARAPDRFEGRNETLDPVGGHIPGAVNRHFQCNLGEDGAFRAPAELRAQFEVLLAGRPAEAVILQCGSGVTACHNALAMHHAGMPGAALYAGSWSEWASDPSRPVATGPA
jgi:thiosulfate/3-mercaptopyruvate sulfurtransferase